jgi:hypothetical protein
LDQRDTPARRFTLVMGKLKGRTMREAITAFDALIGKLQEFGDPRIRMPRRGNLGW